MPYPLGHRDNIFIYAVMKKMYSASTRDRTGDLQIFSLTLSQLSYRGNHLYFYVLVRVRVCA